MEERLDKGEGQKYFKVEFKLGFIFWINFKCWFNDFSFNEDEPFWTTNNSPHRKRRCKSVRGGANVILKYILIIFFSISEVLRKYFLRISFILYFS